MSWDEGTDVFPPGTYVRSHDFPGVWDCYIEGTVDGYGGDVFPSDVHYRIKASKRVWEGREVPLRPTELTVYPPMRGSFGRRTVYRLKEPVVYNCLSCGAQVPETEDPVRHSCFGK